MFMQAEKRDYYIYNTMSRTKELFKPVVPGMVGLYVCGPTVYGDAHLGHARPAITFDVLTRYFRYMGYKVRYVRNITDVGHLEHDSDDGEDKIAKKAKMEQLEPMEVAQECTIKFHKAMEKLNTLPPSIEPHASGHIIEQIQLIQQILDHGFAYISNGSVYLQQEIPLWGFVGKKLRRHSYKHPRIGWFWRQAQLCRFCAVEKGFSGTYHALAIPLERRLSGLAS